MSQLRETIENTIKLLNANTRAKELMQVWPKVIKLEMDSEKEPLFISTVKGQMELMDNPGKSVDITISGKSQAFLDVMSGRKDITYPIATADLIMDRRNIEDMITLSRILRTQERRQK